MDKIRRIKSSQDDFPNVGEHRLPENAPGMPKKRGSSGLAGRNP
jgi:hypothetical protein